MRHHPLIEFIRSLLETIQQNWRYDPIFRCIKTDLLLPVGDDIEQQREWLDQLENYVVAYGIYGSRWTDNKPWRYKRYRGLEEDSREQSKTERELERKINQLRLQVAEPLAAFEKAIKSARSVREKCTVLYQFLIELSVPEKMEKRQQEAEYAGRLDEAKEHAQVWRAVMDTLDQCVEVAGDEALSLELFTKVIDTGLDALQFALVPPAIDQVLVGSLDRMRSSKLSAVFILGINEGILPNRPAEDGLFSDTDRGFLEDRGMHIAEDARGQLLSENELIFRSLTLSKERLYLSYPLASEDGQTLAPSPLINRLKRLFPDLRVRLSPSEPRALPENEQIGFVVSPGKTLGYLSTQIREWRRGYPISDLWWEAYNWFVQNQGWTTKAKRVLSALFYRNEAALTAETARQLYGRTIQASVSRMEKFNACPFSQFVSYGLKLQEREVFQLAAPDIGQLFHSALKMMTARIVGSHRSWADLSSQDCEQLALKTVRELAPKLQSKQILMSSSRHHYLQHKLEQVVARAAKAMRYHAEYSGFSPIGLELPFGPGRPLPALSFKLENGCTMQIVGRIDRVDKGEKDGGILLRIIDYKSSDKDLSLSDVYYGLALQMITYLDVIITNAKDWLGAPAEPAGVLYFHVHNPLIKVADKLPDQELEQQLLKSFKMKGLLLADEQVVRDMDQGLGVGYSTILPVGIKRDGSFYSRSSVADIKGFEALRSHVRKVMRAVGTRITNGDVQIAPYKIKDQMPCTYCSFRSICQFDSSESGNAFRLLKKEPDNQVLGKLLTDGGTEDGGHNEKA
ncbi:helicase-exonuclease AddAB subunit AddB [Terrilactibacillus sp. S3-3]|nr:helicase-exonuclease AddAB subunit AddB [Terrilactibacillus sp. S3-3]